MANKSALQAYLKGNQARYVLLGVTLAFLLTAFGLELSRTKARCTASIPNSNIPSSACDASAFCPSGVYDFSQSSVVTDDSGNTFTLSLKVNCAWSTPTTALNYVAFGLSVIFSVLFSRVKGLKDLNLIAVIAVGGLAAASMITSVGLQANDINKGYQITNTIQASDAIPAPSHSVFLANVIFSSLTFLMLVLGTGHAFLEHTRRSSAESSSAQTIVKVTV